MFDNLHAYTHHSVILKQKKESYLYEVYIQIQKILEFANDTLDYNDKSSNTEEDMRKSVTDKWYSFVKGLVD